MKTKSYTKSDKNGSFDIVYQCPNCSVEITVTDGDESLALAMADRVDTNCPYCGEPLEIEGLQLN